MRQQTVTVDLSEHGEFKGKDEDLSEVDRSYAYALQVNDHGNATLYRRVGKRNQWREVWAVV